ncbi:MalY/PatB family protein [Bacillus sp. 2205SS5-2]|uniref:MalY/PatB family protein n=1 Tax=Bacillus sp. 2205SS5-2 TaxID=3109031 RepID=UPI003003A789
MENFDIITNRKGTASVKWDLTPRLFGEDDILPLWVADMDFPAPNEVIQSLHKRIEHGIFGYSFATDKTNSAVASWFKNRHNWSFPEDAILYSPGVVPSLATAITTFTDKGDRILVQTPVYFPFFQLIQQNDREVIDCPLFQMNSHYEIDFDAFEKSLQQGVKLFLLCNPHNPVGKVWTKAELTKMAQLCQAYNVLIVSDEIHCDLVFPPHQHYAIAKDFKDTVITLTAPSKTFNIAGLQASLLIIENQELRVQYQNAQKKQGVFSLNALGLIGLEAAYTKGGPWLNELISYIENNKKLVSSFLMENLPNVKLVETEGTYLLWLDFRALQLSEEKITELLHKKGKLALEPGSKYGEEGTGFFRMNIGCPKDTLEEAMFRLQRALS